MVESDGFVLLQKVAVRPKKACGGEIGMKLKCAGNVRSFSDMAIGEGSEWVVWCP